MKTILSVSTKIRILRWTRRILKLDRVIHDGAYVDDQVIILKAHKTCSRDVYKNKANMDLIKQDLLLKMLTQAQTDGIIDTRIRHEPKKRLVHVVGGCAILVFRSQVD